MEASGPKMPMTWYRTIHDSKACSIREVVFGMSVTYEITYQDGRKERIRYVDRTTESEAAP